MSSAIWGTVPGFLARPVGKGPWPVVIVIHEWWGLDLQTESIASRFAGQGYLAFAPDLYHGDLAPLGDNSAAMSYMKKHSAAAAAELEVLFDSIAANPEGSGKVASLGFCYGGRLSLGLALARPLDAVCTFYGGQMQTLFDRMGSLRAPVLGFFGDADVSIPAGTIEEFRQILQRQKVDHKLTVYPNSGHAFFRDSDPSVYKPAASADAWAQTLDFLTRHLK
ncbi:MAG: dienelactone hydrolase family protein [Spirochaetales bacterium]